MTIATPGTNTSVELSWNIADPRDDQLRHVTKHDGWSFTVRERQSSAVLTAHHRDGRGGVTDYNTVDQAKAAALAVLHPSEAMAWLTADVPTHRVHTASWGPLYFAAVPEYDGRLRFGYRVDGDLSDQVLILSGMDEVREAATDVLIDHYGPLRPVVDHQLPEAAASPAERLSVAFSVVPGLADIDADDVQQALDRAGLWLRPAVPRSQRAPLLSPEERLSRALSASFWTKRSADDVAELLRRAGLSLS